MCKPQNAAGARAGILMNNHVTAIALTSALLLLKVARNTNPAKRKLGSDVAGSLAGSVVLHSIAPSLQKNSQEGGGNVSKATS